MTDDKVFAADNTDPDLSWVVTCDDPPPGDPPPGTPDPQAVIADLQAQIEAATGSAQRAFQATKDALTAANPGLPPTVFEAPDLETLLASVEAHKATAAHVLEAAKAASPAGSPPTVANPAVTRTPSPIPDHIRGTARIALALEREQAGG